MEEGEDGSDGKSVDGLAFVFEEAEREQIKFRRFLTSFEAAFQPDGSTLSVFLQTKRFEELMNQGQSIFGSSIEKLEKKKWAEDQLRKFEKVEKQFVELERIVIIENLFNVEMKMEINK